MITRENVSSNWQSYTINIVENLLSSQEDFGDDYRRFYNKVNEVTKERGFDRDPAFKFMSFTLYLEAPSKDYKHPHKEYTSVLRKLPPAHMTTSVRRRDDHIPHGPIEHSLGSLLAQPISRFPKRSRRH